MKKSFTTPSVYVLLLFMDYTNYQPTQGQDRPDPSPPNPLQHSWTGLANDARVERELATLQLLTEKATELALAAHAVALARLTAPKATAALPDRRRAEGEPAQQDPGRLFTLLFHLITRAISVESRTAELRRTQDQRDRLAAQRANGDAEQARRTCSERIVRAIVADAIAATGQPLAAYQPVLNQRMFDHDIAALFADHTAAEIAAVICRDLDIPPPAAASSSAPPRSSPAGPIHQPPAAANPAAGEPEPSPADFPHDNLSSPDFSPPDISPDDLSPDDLSPVELEALLRTILTHPSLDCPATARKPP